MAQANLEPGAVRSEENVGGRGAWPPVVLCEAGGVHSGVLVRLRRRPEERGSDGVGRAVRSLAGGWLIPWFYIQDMIGQGVNVFSRYSYLVTKDKIPLGGHSDHLQHLEFRHSDRPCGGAARDTLHLRPAA